jgi:molecular chaperone GrpE
MWYIYKVHAWSMATIAIGTVSRKLQKSVKFMSNEASFGQQPEDIPYGMSPDNPDNTMDVTSVNVAPNIPIETLQEEKMSALLDSLGEVRVQLDGLRGLMETRLQYDATKEEAFSQLYNDLNHFRGQSGLLQARPLYIDLILLLDRLENSLQEWRSAGAVVNLLASFHEEILEILARRNIQQIVPLDTTFDPKIQRAIAIEPITDPSEHNMIARVARRGYEAEGQVLRAEEVVVRRYARPTHGVRGES